MKLKVARLLLPWLLPVWPVVAQAQFTYTDNNGAITITGYTGAGGAVTIPDSINGDPVTSIGDDAFDDCTNLTGVTIPDSVTNIGELGFENCASLTNVTIPNGVISIGELAFAYCISLPSVTVPGSVTNLGLGAFYYCSSLTAAYFQGNAPPDDGTAFQTDPFATVYYLPWTTGWGSTFGSVPTAVGAPQLLAYGAGVLTNQFGFTLVGTDNESFIVSASTNLVNPVWVPLQTNTLNGGTFYFSDPQWTNYRQRFYRLTSP